MTYSSHPSDVLTALLGCYMAGAMRNCCHLGMFCVQHNATMSHHFMQSHIHCVHACLAVTCHLHFWHNDQDLLRVTVVTWEWDRYQNKNQHRKLTPVKKFSCCSCRKLNPQPFSHKSSALTTELSPLPHG